MTEERIAPRFRTPADEYSDAEKAKLANPGLAVRILDRGHPANLSEQFRDTASQDLGHVAETLAKSYGIYLEFNRAKTGSERDWMYMIRITIPGGGPLGRDQWALLDEIADRYTTSESYTGRAQPSLRITTRQNLQIHWVKKRHLVEVVAAIARTGFYTLNGCGDNVRNVMACPLSQGSPLFDAHALAQVAGRYFRLPPAAFLEVFEIDPTHVRDPEGLASERRFAYAPNLLNRKFKIGFSSVRYEGETLLRDNCVEVRTDDLGVVPVVRGGRVDAFQLYVGGGQGERNGHRTFACLGQPLGQLPPDALLPGLDAIVRVHQEWGDRKNRHWSRLKYVIHAMGIDWFRSRVQEMATLPWSPPDPSVEPGPRQLHHGWSRCAWDGRWSYGAFVENGRILDGPNGRIKSLVRHLLDEYHLELFLTPNQDLLFRGIPEELRPTFEAELERFGFGSRNERLYSPLRRLSGACVGRDTCRLAYTDSERFEPELLDILEVKWGDLHESVGITGCERQCFRPATKTIGWTGTGLNQYALRLGGAEDGRLQGLPLLDPETGATELNRVPRKEVAIVTDALFEFYRTAAVGDERGPGGMGYFLGRVGARGVLDWLRADPRTRPLLREAAPTPASPPSPRAGTVEGGERDRERP